MVPANAAPPKRVLIIHSFGNAAPPFTTHSTAFETELTAKMGESVDLDEISLDVARYASLDMEEALVDLLRIRQTKWRPDLVVPVGSPAGIFVATNRDRLFPATTPIVYTGMDRGLLPDESLEQNATFVGESFDLRGWVEDILQIAPDTKTIAVVIGDSPLEHLWTDIMKKEYQPFADRVNFIWFNDLSLDGILQRAKNLPPHSFILHVLMMRDGNGVTHDGDAVLRRIHEVASAPIHGIYQHQLGMGAIGGRLCQGEAQGVAAAQIAIRLFRGEPASSFPPLIIDPLPPRYDWRELQKWEIDEKTLPPGSTVLFRTPTFWEQHRSLVIGVVVVCVAQALLISALIANLVRRRRAERSLDKSEARVTLAATAARLGVWELNTTTGELWASDKARELFEFEAATSLNRSVFSNRVHPEDRAARDAAIDSAVRERGEYELDYRVLLEDGAIRWISERGRCMIDERGKPTRLIGISLDVTERREAQELVRVATEASPSGTLLIDDRGCIVLVNAHIEELFDYERAELIGKPVELLSPERFARNRKADQEDSLTMPWNRIGEGTEREFVARRKDGSEFPIEVGLNPVQMPRGRFVLITIADISARKRAEEEARRQREQIELLGRASLLGEMTASLAHELGQPLTAIIANASAGRRFIDGGEADPGILMEIFSDINTDGRRARDIIQNVRNTIKNGCAMRGDIAINQVVENVALMVRSDAAAHSCTVRTSLAENLPFIDADPVQMQQVLINLVNNAFQAMRETPLHRREVEIMTRLTDHGSIRVTIRDHGPGISETTRDQLFEKFYTTRTDGLGMGLPIVQSIVEAHGGKIDATNAQDGGAQFEFELPACTSPSKSPQPCRVVGGVLEKG